MAISKLRDRKTIADWQDELNAEYEAATTDDERLAVLEKHMGPGVARMALAAIETGATSSCRDMGESTPDGAGVRGFGLAPHS